jgi:hypothetical protein
LVEHQLPKLRVVGSSPIVRSIEASVSSRRLGVFVGRAWVVLLRLEGAALLVASVVLYFHLDY